VSAKKQQHDGGRSAKGDVVGERYRALDRESREWHAKVEQAIERARRAARR
jgi:hypothetical protein